MAYEGSILWDLDGTLLTTAKAGRIALAEAVRDLCGVAIDYGDLVVSGLPDTAVHAVALRSAGIDPDPELVASISAEYVRRLPEALPQREGGVLPGVLEALTGLAERGRVVSLLLTGNTHDGAYAKLGHYGLDRFFAHGGGFCESDTDRVAIAGRAMARAVELTGSANRSHVVVVGDTPHDVSCAAAVGVRSLAVATGTFSRGELERAGADLVLDRVPDVDTLEQFVLGE
jgi:phosphoglycolate phosphatase-like HAD superfamily hydrolase